MDTILETWKSIDGYEGLYEASDQGQIRSVVDRKNTYAGKILKPYQKKNGYYQVILVKDGQKVYARVARIIALTFIPNPNNKPFVNHLNGIKTDNRVVNLEWATAKENTDHAFKMGLAVPARGADQRSVKLTEDQVREIRGLIPRESLARIAEKYGVHVMTIFDIKKGRSWGWLI